MKKTRGFLLSFAAAFLAFTFNPRAQAAPVFFENIGGSSGAFDLAVQEKGIALTTDGFEDLSPGLIDYGQNLSRPGYAISTSLIGSGSSLRSIDNPNNLIEGSRSMILYNNTDPMTFTLDTPANAFAITFKDLDLSFGGSFTVAIDGNPATVLLDSSSGSNLDYFFGVIDEMEAFSTITFNRTTGDGYNFDLVNFGSVPEPTASLLAGIGVALVALRRRATAA